jgi:hypothetical protein
VTLSTVRVGADAFVVKARPNKNFGLVERLRVQNVDDKESYVRFKSPAPSKAKVATTYLYLTQIGAVAGTNTIAIAPLAEDFGTKQVTWATKPSAGGAANITTLTKTAPPSGTVWKFDITTFMQDVANGAPNRGLRIRTQTAAEVVFASSEAEGDRPYVEVEWSTPPSKPVALSPSFAAVSVDKWVQTVDFVDRNGTDALVSVELQIDPTTDFAGSDLWSAVVATTIPKVDLALTTYPGLAAGATTNVRARVTDSSGGTSPWSDPVTVSRVAKGTVAITAPGASPNNFVQELTPPITWTVAGMVQDRYRVLVFRTSDPKKILLDTGPVKSTAQTYTIPKKVLTDGVGYTVTVQVWDNVVRESAGSDTAWVEASRDFTVTYSATVAAASALTALPSTGGSPSVDVKMTRATSPDSWTIQRQEAGGSWVTVDTDVVPADIATSSTTWVYRDSTARIGVAYTYRAKAEVNGVLSTTDPTASITLSAVGIWLVDPRNPTEWVVMGGKEFDGEKVDSATTYTVMGSVEVVRTITGLTGLSGNCKLMYRTREGKTWRQFEQILNRMKSKPTSQFRLLLGDLNIPVVLGDVNPDLPHPDSRPDQVLKMVTFRFWQSGEHPFEVTF